MAKNDKKNEELQGNFSEIKKQLEENIKKFQEANNLINVREAFLNGKEKLKGFFDEMLNQDETNFEIKNFKLKLAKGEYREEETISISNPFIIKEFINFITERIDKKVEELELQIIS